MCFPGELSRVCWIGKRLTQRSTRHRNHLYRKQTCQGEAILYYQHCLRVWIRTLRGFRYPVVSAASQNTNQFSKNTQSMLNFQLSRDRYAVLYYRSTMRTLLRLLLQFGSIRTVCCRGPSASEVRAGWFDNNSLAVFWRLR